MQDQQHIPVEILDELTALRERVEELESSEADRRKEWMELQLSEEHYRVAVDNVAEAIVVNVGTSRVFANKAFLRLHGIDDISQAEGLGLDHFILPEDRPLVSEWILARQRGDPAPGVYEYRILRPDGEMRTVETSAVPIRFDGQSATLTVQRDMTARKLAEQDLLRRSQEMATLFSVANILAQTEHFEEKVAHVLETLAQISQADSVTLRVPDDNELGLKAVASAGPAVQDSPTGVLSYTDSVSGTAYQHGEPVIVNDYTSHPLASPLGINRGVKSLAALPVKNAGQTIGLVIIYSRVPDFFTQERIRFLTTVVGGLGTLLDNARLYEELEYRAEELARSNAELEQFAYVASHDLQEPLRMVSSYVQILAEEYKGELDENADRFIGYAVDGANRMKGLIDGLLAFSRVGTQGEPFESTDCNLIIEQVINGLEETIEDSGASLSQERLPTVNADAIQLSQVFQNLISNALKFSGEGSPNVHISAEQRPEDWVFSVQDNGIGIAERHYERIFKMFQRLHHRSEYEGSGIGLALCHKIVQRHGGQIWVKSKVGEGATFYFSIPKAEMEGS